MVKRVREDSYKNHNFLERAQFYFQEAWCNPKHPKEAFEEAYFWYTQAGIKNLDPFNLEQFGIAASELAQKTKDTESRDELEGQAVETFQKVGIRNLSPDGIMQFTWNAAHRIDREEDPAVKKSLREQIVLTYSLYGFDKLKKEQLNELAWTSSHLAKDIKDEQQQKELEELAYSTYKKIGFENLDFENLLQVGWSAACLIWKTKDPQRVMELHTTIVDAYGRCDIKRMKKTNRLQFAWSLSYLASKSKGVEVRNKYNQQAFSIYQELGVDNLSHHHIRKFAHCMSSLARGNGSARAALQQQAIEAYDKCDPLNLVASDVSDLAWIAGELAKWSFREGDDQKSLEYRKRELDAYSLYDRRFGIENLKGNKAVLDQIGFAASTWVKYNQNDPAYDPLSAKAKNLLIQN